MTIPIEWAMPQLVAFMLVVARMSGLFLLAPVFSSPLIPARLKLMALVSLSVVMTPIAAATVTQVPTDGLTLALTLFKETLIGLALGFSVAIVFSAVQVGASLIDTSIGFSLASIMDPLTSSQSSIIGSFYSMVATLAFLAVNGHYWMLSGFARSFEIVPVDVMPRFANMLHNVQEIFFQLFVMAFQIAAPVLITLLVVDVVLGIVARVVPQMNVFFVGIPLKIAIGMGAIIVGLPTFVSFFEHRVSDIVMGVQVLAGATG